MNKDEPYGRIASSMLKKQRRKNGGMGVRGGEEERWEEQGEEGEIPLAEKG